MKAREKLPHNLESVNVASQPSQGGFGDPKSVVRADDLRLPSSNSSVHGLITCVLEMFVLIFISSGTLKNASQSFQRSFTRYVRLCRKEPDLVIFCKMKKLRKRRFASLQ